MKCVICKNGETQSGFISFLLEKDTTTLVIRDVPAEICENCGEEYLSAETNKKVLALANEASERGVELEMLRFAA